MEILGSIHAFYLFDVADAFDLQLLQRLMPVATAKARLAPKPATPAYVQYQQPPLVVDGEALALGEVEGFRVRVKLFDYGIVSVALSRAFAGSWVDLIAIASRFVEDEALERRSEEICRTVLAPLAPATSGLKPGFLTEDYLVFVVSALDGAATAEALLEERGEEIALLLSGEREPLSGQQKTEMLRHRISYLTDDLVIPTWSTAFVYDTERGAQALLEILEFANSQLLQFRYYDDLLDAQLGRIYADLQQPRWFDALAGRRYTRAAHELHSLFIDVNELTDRTENALKMVGDAYAARVYALTATRVGLDQWKTSVHEKLKTLDDIYRFAIEQTGIARGHLLELTIVLILLFELMLFFLGIMT